MENNFSLKSLDWSSLLKETSEDDCDSDDTFLDPSGTVPSNDSHFQQCDQNSNKGEIYHQPMVQEILDTTSSNQNTVVLWTNDKGNPSLPHQNVQYNFEKDLKVSNKPHLIDTGSFNSHFKSAGTITPVNNYIKDGNEKKHRFESDFGFTEMSCLKDTNTCVNNVSLQTIGYCTNNPTLSTGCTSDIPVDLEPDSCLALKSNEYQSKTLDSELKMCLEPHEMYGKIIDELAKGANYCVPFEEKSTVDFQSAIQVDEKDEVLDGLTSNLNDIMRGSSIDCFMTYRGIPKEKTCSPPLTLSKGVHRKVMPADKVLPNYRKKTLQAEKKLLPTRNCSSAYIDFSNRKCEGGKDGTAGTITDTEDSYYFPLKTAPEALDDKIQTQTKRGKYRDQVIKGEETKKQSNIKVKQHLPSKVKKGRKRKGAVYCRVKQEMETTFEVSYQEEELKKGVVETLEEIETGLEHIEKRVARWVSGTDENPPTRELAFKMLADTQANIAALEHLKKKYDSRRKSIQECDLSLIKLLLKRSKQLEIYIDKSIAEADRLMNMELNEISKESTLTGKEILDEQTTDIYNHPKPILRNSSKKLTTEEGVSNKRHISFSEEVECCYLSCSEPSNSIGPSQSVQEQETEHSSSSDEKETNCISRCHEKVCNNTDFKVSSNTSLTSIRHPHQQIKSFVSHENPELEIISFQNLTIGPCNSYNHREPEVKQSFERKKNNCVVENTNWNDDPILLGSSQTKNSILLRNKDKNENQKIKAENILHPMNLADGTTCVQTSCNGSFYPGENELFRQNDSSPFLFPVNYNCNPVLVNTKYTQNQTKDLLSERTTMPSDKGINDDTHESAIRNLKISNILNDKNHGLTCDRSPLGQTKTSVEGNVLLNETSFQVSQQAYLKDNVCSTGGTDDFNKNASPKLSKTSTEPSDNFGFSEQSAQVEESWENVSAMSIKSIRIKDSSEWMFYSEGNSSDDWADLEDW